MHAHLLIVSGTAGDILIWIHPAVSGRFQLSFIFCQSWQVPCLSAFFSRGVATSATLPILCPKRLDDANPIASLPYNALPSISLSKPTAPMTNLFWHNRWSGHSASQYVCAKHRYHQRYQDGKWVTYAARNRATHTHSLSISLIPPPQNQFDVVFLYIIFLCKTCLSVFFLYTLFRLVVSSILSARMPPTPRCIWSSGRCTFSRPSQ